MSPVILHLTDLHFGWNSTEDERARRVRCLESLVVALRQLGQSEPSWKPTLVVISGDIGWKGIPSDYEQAHLWLSPLLDAIEVAPGNVVVCPGNHDIDRNATRGIPVPPDAVAADESLRPPVPPYYIDSFKAFTNFCQHTAKYCAWRFNNADSWLLGTTELQGLKLLALNTAWYCRGDADRGQLWVGQPHLDLLIAGQPTVAQQTSADPPVVAICHHPFPWWQDAELNAYPRSDGSGIRLSTEELLVTRSNLILTGHTHSVFRQPNHVRLSAYHLNGGASYAGAGWFNSVRLVRISPEGFEHRTLSFDAGDAESAWNPQPASELIPFHPRQLVTSVPMPASSPAIQHYLRRLTEDTRGIQLLGMGRSFQVDLPIDDVYVPLRMVRFTRQTAEDEPDRLPQGRARAETWDRKSAESEMTVEQELVDKGPEWMFRQCRQQSKRGVVVLGEPGAGKTTWARQLAWRLASGTASPEALGLPDGLRPVLLRLRNLTTDDLAAGLSPLLSLRKSVPFCEQFFRELLAAGLAETREDLVQRCLTESISFPGQVFLEVLNDPQASTARRGAVLRLVRDKHVELPELKGLCEAILAERDGARGLQDTAREILERFGWKSGTLRGSASGQPQPGDVRVDEKTGVTLVWIPPGEFRMGSKRGANDEKPVHTVVLTKGFWIGRYVVTNEDYRRFLEGQRDGVRPPEYWDDRRFNQPPQPVVGVSWMDAAAYCKWAGGRLPTEAEWEYACRAGSPHEYCFGDDETQLGDYAWYWDNSDHELHPVGGKLPNAWGLYDMHGNVWEWCGDSMREYSKLRVVDPVGGAAIESRAVRGGSWDGNARNVRCAVRDQYSPRNGDDYLGFRLVRDQDRS